jgi:Zn-dependent peptidase ImmA (M78 family)
MDSQKRMQDTLRGNLLYQYITALERGDIDTIEAVLQKAAQDEVLERMIADVHMSYRSEEDADAYARGVDLVHQLLQQHRNTEPAALLTPAIEEEALLLNPMVAKNTLFKRLKEFGLDKDFVLNRLLPKPLALKLQEPSDSKEMARLVQQASTVVERVLKWEPGAFLRSKPPALNMATVGTTRFKRNMDRDVEHISAYTLYAHHLALLVLQATADLPRKPIPTDPDVVRQEVLALYGTFTFEHVLMYVWSLGIPVLPLNDKGIFHGACWRIRHRNIIVLKQRTMSDARWLFDLLHELCHAGQDPDKDEFVVLEGADDAQGLQLAEEEKMASQFAGNVILDGRAEELVEKCVQAAHKSVEQLKRAVPTVARQEHVSTDALANYMAFRLSLQKLDWWGAANNLQVPSTAAWRTTRDLLLARANIEVLDEVDRDLLLQALSSSEGEGL